MLISAVCIKLGWVNNLGRAVPWYEYDRQDNILSIGFGISLYSYDHFCGIIVSCDVGVGRAIQRSLCFS